VDVIATSDYGDSISKRLQVNTLRCHSVELYSESMQTCMGEPVDYEVEVSNLGRLQETFDVSFSAPWAKLMQTAVKLNPDEKQTLELTVLPPKDLIGIQQIQIDAKSQNSYATNSITVQLNIQNCYDFYMDVSRSYVEGADGKDGKDIFVDQTSLYKLFINNTGSREDTYVLSDNADWVTTELDKITLRPGESRYVNFYLKPTTTGEKEFEITVKSSNNAAIVKTIKVFVNVVEWRGISVSVSPADRSICHTSMSRYEIKVKNTGKLMDTYTITADFGSLSKKSVTLAAGGEETIQLEVDTNQMQPDTEKNITIKVADDKLSADASARVFARSCYKATIDIENDEQTVCQCDMINYTIYIKNTGEFTDEYSLRVNNDEIDKFTLSPGESRSWYKKPYYVYHTPGATYQIPVRVVSKHLTVEKNLTLHVEPHDVCYNVTVEVNGGKGIKVCSANVIPVKIRNSGRRADVYFISFTGPDWVNLNVNKTTLKAGEEKTYYLYLSPAYDTPLGRYAIDLNITSFEIGKQLRIPVEVVENATVQSNVTQEPIQVEEIAPMVKEESGSLTGMIAAGGTKMVLLGVVILVIIGILLARFVFFFK
jgi:uncharacterized membrane protein